MRKVVVLTFVSLDGVMQAPGGPQEDTSGGFKYGGWTVPYFEETVGEIMDKQMTPPFDLLLGAKTYDIFASYWPEHNNKVGVPLNKATKYVVSHEERELSWGPAQLITGDVVAQIQELKNQDGPMLQVHGSSEFLQTLFKSDLVDELWLKIFPIILGSGKRLFSEGIRPGAFILEESQTTPQGVIIASYKRAGEVKTGSFD
ncbi:MAG: dihydrofolate reductase family protein [Candidatus Andersenbacteria bacterium]